MPNIQLAKNLRTLRKANHLTQIHLSTLLNISRQAYSNYENSKRTPDLDSLMHLSRIYDVTIDNLINQNMGQVIAEQKSPYLPALSIKTSDTLYLTDEELDLLLKYRDATQDIRKIIHGFLTSQTKE